MAAQTTSQNLTELANQMFAGAQAATDPAEKAQLLAMAEQFSAQAAAKRVEEAAKERADHEFWTRQSVITNWVS